MQLLLQAGLSSWAGAAGLLLLLSPRHPAHLLPLPRLPGHLTPCQDRNLHRAGGPHGPRPHHSCHPLLHPHQETFSSSQLSFIILIIWPDFSRLARADICKSDEEESWSRRPVQYRDLTSFTTPGPSRASYKITINQSTSDLDDADLQLPEEVEEKTKF